jgi:hypothetical protein
MMMKKKKKKKKTGECEYSDPCAPEINYHTSATLSAFKAPAT